MEIEGIKVCNVVKVENEEYTPYGETWIQEESSSNNMNYITYKFTSKELDDETGLYYFGQRYYDAQTSRFMSADPMNDGLGNGMSIYSYCYNNPLIYTDPTGLVGETTPNTEKDVPGLPGNYRDTEKNHRGNKTQAPVPDNKNKTDIIGGSTVTVITPPDTAPGSSSGLPGGNNSPIVNTPKLGPGKGFPSNSSPGNSGGTSGGFNGGLFALVLYLSFMWGGQHTPPPKKQKDNDDNRILVSHYTSKENAINIMSEGIIRPGTKGEPYVFVLLGISTQKTAKMAGAVSTEAYISFYVNRNEIIKDPNNPHIPSAQMFWTPGPVYLHNRNASMSTSHWFFSKWVTE